jgi:hypothetical protein
MALVGLTIGLGACANPGNEPARRQVTVQGCPIAGVEAGCVMLTGPDGVTYNITAADPKPALGRPIRLTGSPSNDMDTCMQGTKLTHIAWSYTAGSC